MASLKRRIIADMTAFFDIAENRFENYILVLETASKHKTYNNNFAVVRNKGWSLTLGEFFELKSNELKDVKRLAYDVKDDNPDKKEFLEILELTVDNHIIFNHNE